MSLSDKKVGNDYKYGIKVYHSSLKRVRPFVVVKATNSFMYDITGKRFKRTYVYATHKEAEIQQYRMNRNFLSRNNLSLEEYNRLLTKLQPYVDLDNVDSDEEDLSDLDDIGDYGKLID